MKTLLTTLVLLFSFQAQTMTDAQCVYEAENFIDGRPDGDKETISQGCKELAFERSNPNTYRDYGEKDVILFGYRNLILAYLGENMPLNEKAKTNLQLPLEIEIGGKNNISEIHALDVDFDHSKVVALITEKSTGLKSIYTFDLLKSGSQTSQVIIKSEELQKADNIKVEDKIYAMKGDDLVSEFPIK